MKEEIKKSEWFVELARQRQIIGNREYGNNHLKRSGCRDQAEEIADADNILRLMMSKIAKQLEGEEYARRLADDIGFKIECIKLHEMYLDCANQIEYIGSLIKEIGLVDKDIENINRPFFNYKVKEE